MEERNDIVIYKSEDGLVKMEALVDPANETIWASQKAIAALFDCTKQNVSYHMGKIFASGELERSTVVKEILTTAKYSAVFRGIWCLGNVLAHVSISFAAINDLSHV